MLFFKYVFLISNKHCFIWRKYAMETSIVVELDSGIAKYLEAFIKF